MDHMGLHVLSHGKGYKGVLQAKHTKISYRYISICNRCGLSRAEQSFSHDKTDPNNGRGCMSKRKPYIKISPKDKPAIGQYAAQNGIAAAMCHFHQSRN